MTPLYLIPAVLPALWLYRRNRALHSRAMCAEKAVELLRYDAASRTIERQADALQRNRELARIGAMPRDGRGRFMKLEASYG